MIDKISWITVYPEIVLLVMACVILLVDLAVKTPLRTRTYVMTLATLAAVAFMQALYATNDETYYGFGNMVVSDTMGNWLKCFATLAVMVTLVYGRPYATHRDMLRGGELFTLEHFCAAGHVRDDWRQQLPGDLPGSGVVDLVQLRVGRLAP